MAVGIVRSWKGVFSMLVGEKREAACRRDWLKRSRAWKLGVFRVSVVLDGALRLSCSVGRFLDGVQHCLQKVLTRRETGAGDELM